MKHLIRNAIAAVLGVGLIGLIGCEWGGTTGDSSWNDSNSLANFNGTYQGSSGYLVSDYTLASSTSTSGSNTTSVIVTNEAGGTLTTGDKSTYSGLTTFRPVKPSSFALVLGNLGSFTDNGLGVLAGNYRKTTTDPNTTNGTGTIQYETGRWTLTLPTALAANEAITLSYVYTGGSSGNTSSSTPGSSGAPIYVFNVQQTGNNLLIIDNNGKIYKGTMGDVKTTGNLSSSSQGATFVNGDQVSASFTASGTSAAGVQVNIVGTFQGTAAGVSQTSTKSGNTVSYKTTMALSNRTMTGTWIEANGKTGNISGACSSAVNVSFSSNTSTNTAGG